MSGVSERATGRGDHGGVADDPSQGEPLETKPLAVAPPSEFEPDLVQASMEARVSARMLGQTLDGVFARYRIGAALGSGGMGAVYSATDERLGREVAIKVLKRRGSDRALRRLRSEAKSMAAIDHPNVIKVFELGEREGRPFIIMEQIHGPTLREWLCDDFRTWHEVLDVLRGAGEALAAVHRRGMQHRDLKPSNLLVDPSRGAVLIDFGLSRLRVLETLNPSGPSTVSGESHEERITQTGMVVGTPAYMAPESRRDTYNGPETDQWAFCLVLWEALFASRPDGLRALEKVPTPKLGWQPAQGRVPKSIADALLRGMRFDPDERWPDMGALLKALRPPKRKRYIAVALGAALATVGALAAGPPATAELPEQAQTQFAGLYAAAVLDTGRKQAASADPNNSIAPLETAFFAATAAGDETAAAESAASLADVYIVEIQNAEQARYWLNVFRVIIERNELQGTWPYRADATLSKILLMEMKPQEARTVARTASAELQALEPTPELRRLREAVLTSVAISSEHLLEPKVALESFEAALASAEADEACGAAHRLRLKFNVVRSRFYLDSTVETADALAAFAEEVKVDLGEGILLRHARSEVAASMLGISRYAEAKVAAQALLEELPQGDASARPIRARGLLLLGTALSRLGDIDPALEQLNATVAMHGEVFGAEHIMTATAYQELGRALMAAERYDEAVAQYKKALPIVRAMVGPDSDFWLSLRFELGDVFERSGQLEKASAIYDGIGESAKAGSWPQFAASLGRLSLAERGDASREELGARFDALKTDAFDAGHEGPLSEAFDELHKRIEAG